MAQRLVLNAVGIKSPLDVDTDPDPSPSLQAPKRATPTAAHRRHSARQQQAPDSERPLSAADSAAGPFYATGRPVQTSIALDLDCASRLDELARAARVSGNALAVAALHAGMPTAADHALTLIVQERVDRIGARRIERNLRLPEHLRARVDELTSVVRERVPRATRADLINPAVRAHLPADAEHAAELVLEHTRRVERARPLLASAPREYVGQDDQEAAADDRRGDGGELAGRIWPAAEFADEAEHDAGR